MFETFGRSVAPSTAMAKKTKSSDKNPKKPNRTGEALNVWLSDQHAAVLEKIITSSKFRISKTAIVEQAIEALAREMGLWGSEDTP